MGSVCVMLVKLLRVLGVMGLWTRGRGLRWLRLRRSGSKSNPKMMLNLLFFLVWSANVMSHVHVLVSSVVIAISVPVTSDAVGTLLGVEQAKLCAFLGRIRPFSCHLLSPSASERVVFGSDCMRMIVVVTSAHLLGIEVSLVAYGGTTPYPFKLILAISSYAHCCSEGGSHLSGRKLSLSLGVFLDVLFPSTSDVTSTDELCMFFETRRNGSGTMDITLDKVDALLGVVRGRLAGPATKAPNNGGEEAETSPRFPTEIPRNRFSGGYCFPKW